MISEYSDKDIIQRILMGEKSLYELIVRRFNPILYKTDRAYNYNHEDTQDLMQDTYIQVYNNLHKFEGRSGFKTWIMRIMLNNCYKRKEKLSFQREIPKTTMDHEIPMFEETHPDLHLTI